MDTNTAPMDKSEYEFKLIKRLWSFEFYSEGPKGKIKKVVSFTPYNVNGRTCFNLCFGDWDETRQMVDDLIITDNKDSLQVLATVADSVLFFSKLYPNTFIYLKGSTPSRTRLYQMGITKYWAEISSLFIVYGYSSNDKWELFLKNVRYDAFLILRKKELYL
jgi:hypothetical protein